MRKCGLLGGRQLVLVRRDDESNPAKGATAARELIYREKRRRSSAASIRRWRWPSRRWRNQASSSSLNAPGRAGTAITRNGADPNYVFRDRP